MSNFMGVYKAQIYDLSDPLQQGRARLLVPAVLGRAVTGWSLPMNAGLLAQVGDAAWVQFENGDLNRPTWSSSQSLAREATLLRAHSHVIGDLPVADSGVSSATSLVRADDARIQPVKTLVSVVPGVGNAIKGMNTIVAFDEAAPNLTGYLIIHTNIGFINTMTRLHLQGHQYHGEAAIIDVLMTFYPFNGDGTAHQVDWVNNGSLGFSEVLILKHTVNNTIAIALKPRTPLNQWNYPKLWVDGVFGHIPPPDSALTTGWTIYRHDGTIASAGYTTLKVLGDGQPSMMCHANAPQVIGSGSWVQANTWLYQHQHPDIVFSAGGNFTVTKPGLYAVKYSAMFRNDGANANGVRGVTVKNGATFVLGHYSTPLATSQDYVSATCTGDMRLLTGAVISFHLLQNTGAALTIHDGYWTQCSLRRVGN